VKVDNRQSIIDVTIQTAGDASAAFAFAMLNGLSITDDPVTDVELSETDAVNNEVVVFYTNNSIIPATGITTTAENALIEEGVEFWGIEYDFVVS